MQIRPSAHRHGKTVDDIKHAISHHIARGFVTTRQGFDATGTLYVGPDQAGNMTEVISIEDARDGEVIIHAMALRPINARRLLGGGL